MVDVGLWNKCHSGIDSKREQNYINVQRILLYETNKQISFEMYHDKAFYNNTFTATYTLCALVRLTCKK